MQKQGAEHLLRSGPTGTVQLGAQPVSDGRLGPGLLLRLEGSQILRQGKNTHTHTHKTLAACRLFPKTLMLVISHDHCLQIDLFQDSNPRSHIYYLQKTQKNTTKA